MLQRVSRAIYRTLQYTLGRDDVLLAEISEERAFRQLAINECGND